MWKPLRWLWAIWLANTMLKTFLKLQVPGMTLYSAVHELARSQRRKSTQVDGMIIMSWMYWNDRSMKRMNTMWYSEKWLIEGRSRRGMAIAYTSVGNDEILYGLHSWSASNDTKLQNVDDADGTLSTNLEITEIIYQFYRTYDKHNLTQGRHLRMGL